MSGTIKPASSHCLSNADFITEISQVSKRHQGIPFTITRNPTRGGSTSPVVKWHKHTFSQGWWTRGRDGWYSSYRAMVWLPEAFPLPWNLPILLYEPPFESDKYTQLHSLSPPNHSGSLTQRTVHFLSLVKGTPSSAHWWETPLRGRPWLTSSLDAGIRWGRLSPVSTGVFHVRSVRSKVLQIWVCTDHSKFPAYKPTLIM